LDRLEAKQLITRVVNADDARSQKIGLTSKGQKLFEKVFPEHVKYLGEIFHQLSPKDLAQMNHSLKVLRETFEKHSEAS
jgi:DNA-binding MarR family transcriptional regulator